MSVDLGNIHSASSPSQNRLDRAKKKDERMRKANGEGKRKRTLEDEHHHSSVKTKKSKTDPSLTHSETRKENLSNSSEGSPFHLLTTSLYLPLSPISQQYPLKGLCTEHISPLVLTYHAPFEGVVLSYHNARLSNGPSAAARGDQIVYAKSVDEYAASFLWLTVDFLLLRPCRGQWIEGWINLQNEGHLGLVCWNLFNASIERRRLPKDWRWIGPMASSKNEKRRAGMEGSIDVHMTDTDEGTEGHFEDDIGRKIEGSLRFRIRDFDTSFDRDKGFVTLEGTFLEEEEDEAIVEEENTRRRGAGAQKGNGAIDPGRYSSQAGIGIIRNGR